MNPPGDLARELTGLDTAARQHLDRLIASWGLLADLAFSDLQLYVPVDDYSLAVARSVGELGSRDRRPSLRGLHFVVLGQVRPAGNQTLFPEDAIGQVVSADALPLVREAFESGSITTGEWPPIGTDLPCRASGVPVSFRGETIAVMVRVWSPSSGRRRQTLERAYLPIFDRLARMVRAGTFPFRSEDEAVEDPPRVGDGVIVLDAQAKVTFASPNAVSALHRIGVVRAVTGSTFAEMGIESEPIELAWSSRQPVVTDIERRPETIVVVHCIPLLDEGAVVGGAVLVRDVTDLRRRDRLLLSKDAAIREVHHRVKNNLQTISSLLRLQSRRLADRAARDALLEAEHRIRAIAAVHEVLASEPGDQVRFAEIVPTLVQLARDAEVGTGPVEVRTVGDAGDLSGDVATPLALVLAELLANAVEHGFPDGANAAPMVQLGFAEENHSLIVTVHDNGAGFPEHFDIDHTTSLGLAIVRDLVRSQLGGSISVWNDKGAVVQLVVPLR